MVKTWNIRTRVKPYEVHTEPNRNLHSTTIIGHD